MKHVTISDSCGVYPLSPGETRQFIDETMDRLGGRFLLATTSGRGIPCLNYRWDGSVRSTAFVPLNRQMKRLPKLTAVTLDPAHQRKADRRFVLLGWKHPGWFVEDVLDGKEVNVPLSHYSMRNFSAVTLLNIVNGVWNETE